MNLNETAISIVFTDGRELRIKYRAMYVGCIMGAALSYATNSSIAWAVVHGILGWFYVGYYILGGGH